ncbi:hypothetical protein DIPPA_28901 [Diplonema papillatum]|nr:hypothetical protein DIPPA_28901 [Diplonema papillatum]
MMLRLAVRAGRHLSQKRCIAAPPEGPGPAPQPVVLPWWLPTDAAKRIHTEKWSSTLEVDEFVRRVGCAVMLHVYDGKVKHDRRYLLEAVRVTARLISDYKDALGVLRYDFGHDVNAWFAYAQRMKLRPQIAEMAAVQIVTGYDPFTDTRSALFAAQKVKAAVEKAAAGNPPPSPPGGSSEDGR